MFSAAVASHLGAALGCGYASSRDDGAANLLGLAIIETSAHVEIAAMPCG
jgi:hypothetical protein